MQNARISSHDLLYKYMVEFSIPFFSLSPTCWWDTHILMIQIWLLGLHTRIIMLQILCFATSKLNPGCLFKCRSSDDHGKLAIIYKSEKRNEMVQEGYRILGNSGDQWSDLLGSPMPSRSFKLPNPMYYIPWLAQIVNFFNKTNRTLFL